MPAIAHITRAAYEAAELTPTQLDGSTDTIALGPGNAHLFVQNTSGSSQTLSIVGADSAGNADCEGVGQIALNTPLQIVIPDGEFRQIGLTSIRQRLEGVINVTGAPGTGVFAWILD